MLKEVLIPPFSLDQKKIVDNMVQLIRCKTISKREESLVEWSEVEKFQEVLMELYPLVHEKSSLKKIGKTGLLYHFKGEQSKNPAVLMAHYDVVPIEEEGWEKPAFEGIVEDGIIWGRGTLDTKGTLCGILEAMEYLLKEGYQPKDDIYFSFSGEEEVDGESCSEIVSYLEEIGVTPSFVLDEGGAVVEKVFPGVAEECALIGISEKGSVNIECIMSGNGGHASTPPVHTILGRLSKAVVAIEKRPFKAQMTKPVKEMFEELGSHAGFGLRIVFANMWLFQPILFFACKKVGGELNAMVRTTCAVTKMEGSKAFNVLPPKASIGMNLRLLGNDTMESSLEYLKKVVGDDQIEYRIINGMNPSICSDTKGESYQMIKEVVHCIWPEAIVSPYLMMACSEDRKSVV